MRYLDEIVLLERVPASARVLNYPETKLPQEVMITAYPHRKPASPEHVAGLYKRELLAVGIPCEETTQGNMGFEFKHGRLRISIRQRRLLYTAPKRITLPPTPFPHPSLIAEFYRTLIGTSPGAGFRDRLAVRKRGRGPSAANLIPALVVVCLKTYGAVGKQKDVHRLLNTYVLCASEKAALPEGVTTSEVVQLSRDVNKWKDRLALHDLYGPYDLARRSTTDLCDQNTSSRYQSNDAARSAGRMVESCPREEPRTRKRPVGCRCA